MSNTDHRDQHIEMLENLNLTGKTSKVLEHMNVFLNSFNYDNHQLYEFKNILEKCDQSLRDGQIIGSAIDSREGTGIKLANTYDRLAELFLETENWDTCIELALKAIEFDTIEESFRHKIHCFLVECYEATNQTNEAMTHLDKALTYVPDDLDCLYKLGMIYGRMRRYPEAAAAFEKYLKFDQTTERAAQVKLTLQQTRSMFGQKKMAIK